MKKAIPVLLFLLPILVLAYTNPGSATGYVNDFAGVLAPADKTALENKLMAFTKQSGDEIAVVTIKSLDGDTIENFAVQLFKEWGIGQKGKDNGVLVLVAPSERQVRIEVGYGLEGALTDAQSYWIIQNQILPAFKTGDYAKGLSAGVDKIIAAIGGEVIPTESGPTQFKFNSDWLWFGLFIFIWLASVLARSKSWWAGGVVGAVIGVIVGVWLGFIFTGLAAIAVLTPLGLLFDYYVSKKYAASRAAGLRPPWWIGGGGSGGFGGGMSGGGGSSGNW